MPPLYWDEIVDEIVDDDHDDEVVVLRNVEEGSADGGED